MDFENPDSQNLFRSRIFKIFFPDPDFPDFRKIRFQISKIPISGFSNFLDLQNPGFPGFCHFQISKIPDFRDFPKFFSGKISNFWRPPEISPKSQISGSEIWDFPDFFSGASGEVIEKIQKSDPPPPFFFEIRGFRISREFFLEIPGFLTRKSWEFREKNCKKAVDSRETGFLELTAETIHFTPHFENCVFKIFSFSISKIRRISEMTRDY